MTRVFLSIVALSLLIGAQSHAVSAAQQKKSATVAGKPARSAVVNINLASAADLESLPGIGPKTAARIVEYRQKNGPFKKIEEILETSRSCPYSLSVFDLWSRPSVSGSRQKSQQISR